MYGTIHKKIITTITRTIIAKYIPMLFEEIISLLHCFSMKEYSHRRVERKLIEQSLNKK